MSAGVRRRQAAGVKAEAPSVAVVAAPARGDEEPGMAAASSLSACFKLLAAAFYGFSSFLIVMVNKSVLTSYG